MKEQIRVKVVFRDPMWCVVCTKHGEDCAHPSKAEAIHAGERHAQDDGVMLETPA